MDGAAATVATFTTLARGVKRKELTDYLTERRQVKTKCEIAYNIVAQQVDLANTQLAAIPEVKTEEFTEAKSRQEALLAQTSLDLNEALFKTLAVGDEIWMETEDYEYSKAQVTSLRRTIEHLHIQYCVKGKTLSQAKNLTPYPQNFNFDTICCLPVKMKDLDEAATQALYHAIAAVQGNTLFFTE